MKHLNYITLFSFLLLLNTAFSGDEIGGGGGMDHSLPPEEVIEGLNLAFSKNIIKISRNNLIDIEMNDGTILSDEELLAFKTNELNTLELPKSKIHSLMLSNGSIITSHSLLLSEGTAIGGGG
ncbi:MAG: hypothetical protein HOL16_00190 [Alphaproteobacteria bacterium]|jgi:hypothetical protein|nr:hypothetical protein [Alphaproteobacteria bacterium]